MILIDGLIWEIPCNITRVSEIRPSEVSGFLLDRNYHNDVLGTYLRYEITITVPRGRESDYNLIYELLSEPVDGHAFVLPYNSDTIALTGRIENVQDVYVQLAGGRAYWKGIKFSVVANHPSKIMSLEQVLARGRTPLPEVSTPEIGALYQYTAEGWVPVQFSDADATEY